MQGSLRSPPHWSPEMENEYPLRHWMADVIMWLLSTDLSEERKGPAVELALGIAEDDPRALTVTMPAGTSSPITAKVVYTGPIKAPIAKGQHIADLVIASPDTGEQRMPLVAEKDVAEAGFFGRVWASLTSLFA